MKITEFFKKNWIHFALIAAGLLVIAIYFKPQLEGYGVKQHDIEQWQGMSHETNEFRDKTGQEALWTNSMFGGMPAEQISVVYDGNWFKGITNFYFKLIPNPIGTIFLHLLSFLLFARFLKIRPLVGFIGAIAFCFASYEMEIIQAGHITKSMTVAFLPAILGAFIYAYRQNRIWGLLFSGVLMAFDLAMNHLQVTYYFIFVLLFVGIFLFFESMQKKQLKSFVITTAGLVAVYILAAVINIGNIWLTSDYAKGTIRGANDITVSPDGDTKAVAEGGLEIDYITQWSYGVGETFTIVSPYVKGGGSMALGNSPFVDQIDNSEELSSAQINAVKGNNAYWGEQPGTSGPVYIGAIVCFLAFLGLFFMKDNIKWPLLIVTAIVIMLSWGKNFMGLTEWMVDHFPMYNKFRAVTIILVIAELTIPVLGVLFLNALIDERDAIREKKNTLFMATGGFILFLLIVKFVGLGDNFTNPAEANQMATMDVGIRNQIMNLDPEVAKTQYNLDLTNPMQVEQFVNAQAQNYEQGFQDVKKVRKEIFNSSMNRSILFCFLAAGLILFFVLSKMEVKVASVILSLGMIVLVIFDLLPIASNYLGNGEDEISGEYKFWEDATLSAYPIAPTAADNQILELETANNAAANSAVKMARNQALKEADELGYIGQTKTNFVAAKVFSALNFNSNYRVFDLNGAFNSSKASYFHKSLGGYHGAKLRNIQNMIDFHISKMNSKVLDMMNVKYMLQTDQSGADIAIPNQTALGNSWLVKNVKTYDTPDDEIRALGSEFVIENKGAGQIIVNGKKESKVTVYGTEKLQYALTGKDTVNLQMPNGLQVGTEAMMVMDINGKTNYVPMSTMALDTAKSFTPLVALKMKSNFEPKETAVMLDKYASQLSKRKFDGEGTIRMLKYAPNKITYEANVNGTELAVFSEVFYDRGWKAYVNGKETKILKVDYILRGLELKKGKNKIEFVYHLDKFDTANLMAKIGSILLLLLLALGTYFTFFKKVKKEIVQL